MDPAFAEKARIRSKKPPRRVTWQDQEGSNADQSRRRRSRSRRSAGCRRSRRALVRDLRVRWALEEAGSTIGSACSTPEAAARLSEGTAVRPGARASRRRASRSSRAARSSNISARRAKRCCRRDPQGRYRAIQWTYAALNSVEPAILNAALINVFFADEEWAKLRRAGAERLRAAEAEALSDWLGDKQWLEGDRFTIGDLIMVTVLRILRHTGHGRRISRTSTPMSSAAEARPAFQQALADQLAAFAANEPQPEGAAA